MNLEEFNNLMNLFIDDEFSHRELPIIFNISMRLQINEIDSDRHYNMSFPEFIEAFCRVIDKDSPIPIGEKKVIKFQIKIIFFRRIGQIIKELSKV